MKTLQKKIITAVMVGLFAISGHSAYALNQTEINNQLTSVQTIVSFIVANPQYRSLLPAVADILKNISKHISEEHSDNDSMLVEGKYTYTFANIDDIDFDLDEGDKELRITINGTDGGCSEVQDIDVEQEEDDVFSVTLMERNPTDKNIACTADIRYFEKEVTIDLDDLDDDTYDVLVNDDKEFEFTISDEDTNQNSSNSNNAKNIKTSAKRISQDGAANDYAEFEIEFDIKAFGDESFVSDNADDSVNFVIMDGGTIVYDSNGSQQGTALVSINSSADLDDGFYRLSENSPEEFIVTVSFDPYSGTPAGSGSYKLQLKSLEYASRPGGSTFNFKTNPQNDFRTKSVQIVD